MVTAPQGKRCCLTIQNMDCNPHSKRDTRALGTARRALMAVAASVPGLDALAVLMEHLPPALVLLRAAVAPPVAVHKRVVCRIACATTVCFGDTAHTCNRKLCAWCWVDVGRSQGCWLICGH